MRTSRVFLKSLISLNLLLLGACNLPAPQSRDSEGSSVATFYITEAKGDALEANISKDSILPQSKVFNFTVCLKDRAQSKPLVGHPFRIEEIGKELKTDDKGCLNWSETVPFNFSSTPKYLEWRRQVTATGLHRGSRTAEFAINPWNENDGSEAVVNIAEHRPENLVSEPEKIKEALKGSGESQTPGTMTNTNKNLWVNDIKMQSTEQKFTSEGVTLNFDMAITPQLIVSKLNGEKVLRPLNQGRFKAKIYLIHSVTEGDKDVRVTIAESSVQTAAINGNSLFIKAPMNLAVLPTRGQLILGIDISSVEDASNIGTFQGVYSIGEYDQLKTTGMLRLLSTVTDSKDFSIGKFVNTDLATRLREHPDAYNKPRIEIAPLEFKFIRVGHETTSDREIVYNVKACLRNGLEQKSTRGYTFNITGFRQSANETPKTLEITTDNSSCVSWDETLSFKYYECQKYIKGSIDIENKELALKQQIDIALNPWEAYGTFARDLRYVDAKEQLLTDCKKDNVLPSTMSLRTFNFTTLSYDYEIDHQLNLQVKKKIRFKLDAAVSVFSDMAKGRMESAQKLRPGVYLLKLALIKNRDYYNEKTYVSSAEQLVATLDGDIKADIEFKTADLKAMSDRNTLLVELDPVQESKVAVDKNGNVTVKGKVNSLDDVIDTSAGLYNRTFSAVTNINLEKDAQELTAVEPAAANHYLTSENLPNLSAAHKSMVREYIHFGQQFEKARLQNQRAQSDMNAFANENSLRPVVVNNLKTYEDLRRSLTIPSAKMTDAKMQAALNRLAVTGKLPVELTAGFCGHWFKTLLVKDLSGFAGSNPLMNCLRLANQPENLFSVEKRLFVRELGGYQRVRGFNSGITIGNNITLTKSKTHTTTHTKTLTFNMGLSNKFANLFLVGMSGSYAISQADAKSEGTSTSAVVNTNINLILQENVFRLKLNRYQECAIVKLNPKHFLKDGIFATSLNAKLGPDQKADVASRGMMVCTGVDNTKPIEREESYYLINQETTSLQSQDSGDERNRHFFAALRGEKEFQRLMYFMKGQIKMPNTADRSNDDHKSVEKGLDILFKSGSANIPGSYNDSL